MNQPVFSCHPADFRFAKILSPPLYLISGSTNEPMLYSNRMKKLILTLLTGVLVLTACSHNTPPDTNAYKTSQEVLKTLKRKDMEQLSAYVNPQKGVRFSPYLHVELDTDRKYTKEEIKTALNDTTVKYWGIYDGSGEPISLTFAQYFDKFIYSGNFLASTEISISATELRSWGTIIDNDFEVYPDATIVQYHLPGIIPEYGGMDWQSLRLVFEKEGKIWYLVGIVHDQWTT